MRYRPEIDGLRAVAVISVVLYHAQIFLTESMLFTGGYLGVDVFFVISGYLITNILLLERASRGRFRLLKFYEKRARRILPLLFFVIAACLPFAWFILLPSDFVEFSESAIAAVLQVSHFFFHEATTEYGAQNSLLKPLLHTWSLGIEWQFYITFPLFLYLTSFLPSQFLLTFIVLAGIASLSHAEMANYHDASFNFYSPLSRLWEFLVGSIIAYSELKRIPHSPKKVVNALPIIGLALIIYSAMTFNDSTNHPGLITLLCVLGAALIIAFANPHNLCGKLLSLKPLVAIGLISYSIYLWHFPILAFMRHSNMQLSPSELLIAALLTISLSTLSYLFIEKPFRNAGSISTKRFALFLLTLLSIILAFSYLVIEHKGFEDRIERHSGFIHWERDNGILLEQSWEPLRQHNNNPNAFPTPSHNVLIIGNSHAKDTYNAFYLNRHLYQPFNFAHGDIRQIACLAEKNIPEHKKVIKRFYNSEKYKLSNIIIVSTAYHDKRHCISGSPIVGDHIAVRDLVRRAREDGKKVVLTSLQPLFGNAIGVNVFDDYLKKAKKSGTLKDALTSREKADAMILDINKVFYESRDFRGGGTSKLIENIAAAESIPLIHKEQLLCNDTLETCYGVTPSGNKMYYDRNHYTLKGSLFFGKLMLDNGVLDILNALMAEIEAEQQQ